MRRARVRRLPSLLVAALLAVGLGAAAVAIGVGVGTSGCEPEHTADWSVAREWNEQALAAIRRDFPAPTVHARNLYHLSVVMWDVSSAGGSESAPVLTRVTPPPGALDPDGRETAISYGAYRLLTHRYENATGGDDSVAAFAGLMDRLCLPTDVASIDPTTPAGFGLAVADEIIAETRADGSLEPSGYRDLSYVSVNPPLVVAESGVTMVDPNRWQPLALSVQVTQNGQRLPGAVQEYVGPNWGYVTPFSLPPSAVGSPVEPDPPPMYGTEGFAEAALEVVDYSSRLDPADRETIAIDPGSRGANPVGTNDGRGRPLNPATGEPYPANVVLEADYGRAIAEFWADGPDSETPPGHWNTIANEVSDRLEGDRLAIGGQGPSLDRLAWDLHLYLALNGALHDAAIAAWGSKAHYDYVRPISMIRYLAQQGELPLVPGLAEIVTAETAAAGERHDHLRGRLGEVAVFAWRGQPEDPADEVAGVGWVPASEWVPYQRASFVTPSFPGYVSGHSTFSRAGAEILTAMTGSEFFPGGLATQTVESLIHERGPTVPVTLQWATYYDAADEAGLSRLYGGIHVEADDLEGRLMGAEIGRSAWAEAREHFTHDG